MVAVPFKHWIKARQHSAGIRQALRLTQRTYGLLRRTLPTGNEPKIAGGWPVRCVPLPPPRPITRFERRALRRASHSPSAAFFDGHSVTQFEQRLAHIWGCKHALALSSGTAALHTAVMAAQIGPGDEVIVPVMTYVATALAVMHAGAVPRFVDADPETWNIDATQIEAAINDRTRAIIPVHIGGVACDMAAIMRIATKHNLVVIEDAAHAHGSTLNGKWLGTVGHIGCFSFGSPKTITTGEGGALMTDDPELARRARMAMNLGEYAPDGVPSKELDYSAPETRLDYEMVGWNYRMSVMQAALGLGHLDRLDHILRKRRQNAAFLREQLADIPGVATQRVPQGAEPCYYSFPMTLTEDASLSRGDLLRGLAAEKIDFRLWSNLPLAEHAIFKARARFPVAERVCAGFIGLRVDPVLDLSDMATVVASIRRLLEWGQRRRSTEAHE